MNYPNIIKHNAYLYSLIKGRIQMRQGKVIDKGYGHIFLIGNKRLSCSSEEGTIMHNSVWLSPEKSEDERFKEAFLIFVEAEMGKIILYNEKIKSCHKAIQDIYKLNS